MDCFDGLHISAEWNKYKRFKVGKSDAVCGLTQPIIEMSREDFIFITRYKSSPREDECLFAGSLELSYDVWIRFGNGATFVLINSFS